MIRIAICDDEKNIRTYLSSLVRKQNIECEITEYASTDEYLSDQKEHDLLFLDIEMKSVASGMDGMSMAKQIRATELTKQPIIIFVTGYEKYVYDAFDVGAFQYLLKPIDEQRFPSDVLYRMNTDTVLRQKVYDMLADYSSDKFKLTMQTLNPPVKKCTLVFDDNGEVVATLEPDVGGEKAASERSKNTEKVRIMNGSDIKALLQNDIQEMIEEIERQGVMATEYKKKSIL